MTSVSEANTEILGNGNEHDKDGNDKSQQRTNEPSNNE